MPNNIQPSGFDPSFDVDQSLPIAAHQNEIAQLIATNQVVVVAGETGSGKTTQLPKICLGLGRKKIAHTQPRRIAARSVCQRIADELGVEVGEEIGFQVRFTRKASPKSRLVVMTDGILLNDISHDKKLTEYDTIIIDEAHERSLNIDFLLGYLKTLLGNRPDLKLIITSATIDTARFSAHFDDAPIVEVSGRTYPVEIRYQPIGEDQSQDEAIAESVVELMEEGPGDILVFLPGERDIRETKKTLESLNIPTLEVLPLYARLSFAEQNKIFTPGNCRRIVLATNVAETSITVPGIKYVIDTGTARVSRYSNRTKVQRLPIEEVSQASANQRAGRCGRLGPGVCIRLYSTENFAQRDEFTEPEILRTNLASVILKMADIRLGQIADFPFVEPPDRAQVVSGMKLLEELGALQVCRGRTPRLTKIGRKLARLPVDPRLGRMLIEAEKQDCLREMQIIVAGLSIPDIREYPQEDAEEANRLHARFFSAEILDADDFTQNRQIKSEVEKRQHPVAKKDKSDQKIRSSKSSQGGDIAALIRIWKYLGKSRKELSGSKLRKLCRGEYLNFLRYLEWQDLRTQLQQICADLGMKRNQSLARPEEIIKALLAGLLGHVGLLEVKEQRKTKNSRSSRVGPREYLAARGTKFSIQPGSALAKNPPELVVAVELVETSRLWARQVEEIKPEWVEEVGAHLVKHSYSEPYWSTSAGAVLAREKTTLFGIPISCDKLVNYQKINPVEAREIFIQHALVEQEWRPKYPFVYHNEEIRKQASHLEEKSRSREMTISDYELYEFFDRRIPLNVCSTTSFDAWWAKEPNKNLLSLTLSDLLSPTGEISSQDYPDSWQVNDKISLPVSYVFNPGDGEDGVSVTIPLGLLNQVPEEPFTWQVPGLRAELTAQLIRTLPKSVRTSFVPVPDTAKKVCQTISSQNLSEEYSYPYPQLVAEELTRLSGKLVSPDQFDLTRLPDYLQVGFVVTEGSTKIASGKSLVLLQRELADKVTKKLTKSTRQVSVSGKTSWVFDSIPTKIKSKLGDSTMVGYPGLTDEGNSVGVRTYESETAAKLAHRNGIRRLLVLTNPDPTRWVVSHLSNKDKFVLGASPYPSVKALLADAWLKTSGRLAGENADLSQIRQKDQFDQLAVAVRVKQADEMCKLVSKTADILREYVAASKAVDLLVKDSFVHQDMADQLANLVFDGFISAILDPWFDRIEKYLIALKARADLALTNPGKEEQLCAQLDDLEEEYSNLCARQSEGYLLDEVSDIGFMIEELRVQTFAQPLGTVVSVSPKRIRKAMEKINSAGR